MLKQRRFRFGDLARLAVFVGVAVLVVTLQSNVFAYSISLIAVDDTWVREDNATSNRNGDDQMNLRTDIDADDNDAILLRFDVSSLPSSAGAATLQLFWNRSTGDSAGKILEVYGVNEGAPREATWTDDLVIYGEAANPSANDAPGMIADDLDPSEELLANPLATADDLHDRDVANTSFLGQLEVPDPGAVQNSPLSFSSSALADFINNDTDGAITLLLFRDATTSSHQLRFWPREYISDLGFPEFSPTLVVVPEPGTIALIGLGGIALVGLARRRR